MVTHSTKAWILIKYLYALCRETLGWSSVWYMGPTVWITLETGSLKPLSNISEHKMLSTNGSLTGFGKYWQHHIKRTQKTYGVILASPVGQRTLGRTSGTSQHAARSSGPAALCIAETSIVVLNMDYLPSSQPSVRKLMSNYLHPHHHLQAFSHLLHLPAKQFLFQHQWQIFTKKGAQMEVD